MTRKVTDAALPCQQLKVKFSDMPLDVSLPWRHCLSYLIVYSCAWHFAYCRRVATEETYLAVPSDITRLQSPNSTTFRKQVELGC
jgi:hypothetical protein